MKKISFQLIIALFIFSSFNLSAEKSLHALTLDEAKAHYLLEVIIHIERKLDKDRNDIVIGLLGKNDSLHDSIQQKISGISVRKKTLTVRNIPKKSNRKNYYSVVLVTDKKLNNIPEIFNRFGPVLIVVDGRVNKTAQLVSLIKSRGQINIEINHKNLILYGFKISNNLLNFAGTKKDLTGQLNEQKNRLENLIKDAEEKRKTVEYISKTLAKKNSALGQVKMVLEEKNEVLSQSISKLNDSKKKLQTLQLQKSIDRAEIKENTMYMSQQKILLDSKKIELSNMEKELSKLVKNIDKNIELFGQQKNELLKKNNIITIKEETISGQRMLLFLAVGAIVIITVFVYSILRLVLMQKKANKELSRLNEQLYELATTDSMTQLFNRRHFIESAQRQIIQLQRTGADGAMLMIDIDDFKGVNDSFGHAMGDECIANVASILKDNLREYDLVGRVGGEEYAMLLSQCELDRASQIAERLREKIADMSVSHQQDTINITISIGLTMIQKGENEIDKALQTADIALYKAKSMGKNRVVIC